MPPLQKGGNLVSLGADAYQGGVVARLGAFAPEPSLRQTLRFAHLRTATPGSVSFFPFWWIRKKPELY